MGKVKDVFIFTNGNTMVMDVNGEQMPDYQGFILDIAPRLIEVCDKDTNFEFAKWKGWSETANFSWWFEKYKTEDSEEPA